MLEIKQLIKRLSKEEIQEFSDMLKESKAEKSYLLFQLLKEDKKSDDEITETLEVNSTAYYTLRSRLYDKLQEFMLKKIEGPKVDILEKVNNIEYIIFNYTSTQAFSILQKLETELKRTDQHIYLLKVYDALMRLSKQKEQYFYYSQEYNANLTFLIDFEKTQELMADFISAVGEHKLSREPKILERLHLILEQLVEKDAQYENTTRIFIIRAIVSIYYQLYLEEGEQELDLNPVEDIFQKVYDIIEQNKSDHYYGNLKLLFDYLNFRYYNKYGIKKKEEEFFVLVNDKLTQFLNSYGFYCIPTYFLKGKLLRALEEGNCEQMLKENETLEKEYDVDQHDIVNYVYFKLYLSYCHFYNGDYEKSNGYLNDLRNNVSFKNYPHCELEIKSLLSLNYVMQHEYELSNSLLKSIGRKINTLEHHDYQNVKIFRKIVQNALKTPTKDRRKKMITLMHQFNQLNQGKYKAMEMLRMDEKLIDKLLDN